jgi:CRISPR-associated protein Cas2
MYLDWVQNSVFEGEITKAQLMKIKTDLKELIKSEDNIRIYCMRMKKYMDFYELGEPKVNLDNII